MTDPGNALQAFLDLLHADDCPPELSLSIENFLCILFDISFDHCSYISSEIELLTGNKESWYRGRRSKHFLKKVIHPRDFHTFYVDIILSPPKYSIPCDQLNHKHNFDIKRFNMRIAHKESYWIPIHGELIRLFRPEEERPELLLACVHPEIENSVSPELLFDALTPREMEILQLISNGDSSKIIATRLNISRETVVSHRKNLINKFKVKNSVELVKMAVLQKLIN